MSIEHGEISNSDIWPDIDDSPVDVLTGNKTTSGHTVNAHTALQHHAVWRAVRMISADVAKTALHVYSKENNSREKDKQHPASSLIKRKPNDIMTAFHFWQCEVLSMLLFGNGYAFVLRDPQGNPIEFIPLDPRHTYPARQDGKFLYLFEAQDEAITIEPHDMLHFRYMTMDGVIGLSPLHYARNVIGLGLSAHKWQSVFFKNGAKMSVVLEHPATLGKDETIQKIKQRFSELYSGSDRAHNVAVLQEGMTARPFSVNPKDSQVIELLQANVKEVANVFGVPATRLGDPNATSYSSLEQEDKVYLASGLDPVLVSIESELTAKLVDDPDSHFIEYDRSSWMRPDAQTQAEFFNKALAGAPYMTINQVRGIQNMPPIDDPKYDVLLLPSNNFQPETETTEPATQQSSRGIIDGLIGLAADTTTRAHKRCCGQVKPGETPCMEKWEPALDADFRGLATMIAEFSGQEADELCRSMKGAVYSSVSQYATELGKAPKRKTTLITNSLLELQKTMEGICHAKTNL